MKLTTRPDLQPALAQFRKAAALRTELVFTIQTYEKAFGTGTVISGGACKHWGYRERMHVRMLNQEMNAACDAGFASRPPRVRSSTMRALYQQVMQ